MNKPQSLIHDITPVRIATIVTFSAAALMMLMAPSAHASRTYHEPEVQWSVTIGSPYGSPYRAAPSVVYTQPYVQPYVQPQPVYVAPARYYGPAYHGYYPYHSRSMMYERNKHHYWKHHGKHHGKHSHHHGD